GCHSLGRDLPARIGCTRSFQIIKPTIRTPARTSSTVKALPAPAADGPPPRLGPRGIVGRFGPLMLGRFGMRRPLRLLIERSKNLPVPSSRRPSSSLGTIFSKNFDCPALPQSCSENLRARFFIASEFLIEFGSQRSRRLISSLKRSERASSGEEGGVG